MRSSHETADARLVEVLTSEAPSAIALARGAGLRASPGRTAATGSPAAAARPRKRLLQVGDRTGHAITKALREAFEAGDGAVLAHHRLTVARAASRAAGAPRSRRPERTSTRRRWRPSSSPSGGRCFAEAATRGELSTNHPNATGETTQIALDAGAEARDLDALQYHPNGGAWPATMQGYSIPETTRAYGAVLLNADGEEFTDSLGPRDVVVAGDLRRGRGRARRRDRGRPAGGLARHDADRPRPTPTSRSRTCCAATAARASTRSPSRSSRTPCSTTRTAGS